MNEYLTNGDLAKLLHVSDEAIKRFRIRPKDPLPHLRAGRRYLYISGEVEAWARRQAVREQGKR